MSIGSKGYPRGQCQVRYIVPMSSLKRGMADPTLYYAPDDQIESEIERISRESYKLPDVIERGVFGNPKAVALRWYFNPEDAPKGG